MLRAGIDEAGRGPVLGPLVAGLVVLDRAAADELEAAGVTDSKLLSPQRREELAERIRGCAVLATFIVAEAADVDEALNDPRSNLNRLEAKMTGELLTRLPTGACIVAVDLPSRNEAAYRGDILRFCRLSKDVNLLLEHKADLNHVACAAASIIAKVERDRRIRAMEATVGVPIGSGYAHDPVTREFLASHGRSHKHFFRTSWASYTHLFPVAEQRTLL